MLLLLNFMYIEWKILVACKYGAKIDNGNGWNANAKNTTTNCFQINKILSSSLSSTSITTASASTSKNSYSSFLKFLLIFDNHSTQLLIHFLIASHPPLFLINLSCPIHFCSLFHLAWYHFFLVIMLFFWPSWSLLSLSLISLALSSPSSLHLPSFST